MQHSQCSSQLRSKGDISIENGNKKQCCSWLRSARQRLRCPHHRWQQHDGAGRRRVWLEGQVDEQRAVLHSGAAHKRHQQQLAQEEGVLGGRKAEATILNTGARPDTGTTVPGRQLARLCSSAGGARRALHQCNVPRACGRNFAAQPASATYMQLRLTTLVLPVVAQPPPHRIRHVASQKGERILAVSVDGWWTTAAAAAAACRSLAPPAACWLPRCC